MMFAIHMGIFCGYIVLFLLSMNQPIPKDENSKYLYPFQKIAAQLIWIRDKRGKWKKGKDYDGQQALLKRNLSYLHPAENEEQVLRTYRIRRLSMILALIFAGNMLAFFLYLSGFYAKPLSEGGLISRNEYGKGEKTVALDIYAEGEMVLENQEVTIREQQYSAQEMAQKFEEIGAVLETEILGDNDSLDVVCYDLNLVNEVKGYPVSIEWELSNYSLMSRDGKIDSQRLEDTGSSLDLTAKMYYSDLESEHFFHATLYPLPKDEKGLFLDRILEQMKDYEKRTGTYQDYILPSQVDGRHITYKVPEKRDNLYLLIGVLIASVFAMTAGKRDVEKELKKREEQMLLDYPQIVSKLSLLLGAGMTVPAALSRMGREYERRKKTTGMRFAYEELLVTTRELGSGVSEQEAYLRYGNRCHVQRYVKLSALLSQNVKKGSASLLSSMAEERRDAFEERKHLARKLGEEAGTKLLIPMGIMLVITMGIIILPAFLSMNF